MTVELRESFRAGSHFDRWWSRQRDMVSDEVIARAVNDCLVNGIRSPLFGDVPPGKITLTGTNLREGLRVHGLSSRQRVLLELLAEQIPEGSDAARIYSAEVSTPLEMWLGSHYPFFVGAQLAEAPAGGEGPYGTHAENVETVAAEPSQFDVVVACDVLDKMPDIHAGLSQLRDVLVPGGVMLATFPFTWTRHSKVLARSVNGIVVRLGDVAHGTAQDVGRVTYQIPGWEVMDWANDAGFADVEMVVMASRTLGLFGTVPPLLNVMRCRRPSRSVVGT